MSWRTKVLDYGVWDQLNVLTISSYFYDVSGPSVCQFNTGLFTHAGVTGVILHCASNP